MAVIPCPNSIDCATLGIGVDVGIGNDPDFPITNYSSEGPEQVPTYDAIVFPNLWDKMGCLSLCTSTVSQNAANLCALAQTAQCNPQVPQCPPDCGPPGTPPTFYFNHATSCSCVCPGGSEFFYFVPAGIFSARTQAVADALANSFCHAQCSSACDPGGNTGGGGFALGPIPSGCLGTAYSQAIAASRPVVLWTISAGALPPGLQLNAQTGLISGTLIAAGIASFQVRAYNVDGNYAQRNYTFYAIDIFPATLPDAELGLAYTQTLSAAPVPAGTLAWQVASGILPDGLTLNATTGVISGTPTFATTYNFVISVTSATFSCKHPYVLKVVDCAAAQNVTTARTVVYPDIPACPPTPADVVINESHSLIYNVVVDLYDTFPILLMWDGNCPPETRPPVEYTGGMLVLGPYAVEMQIYAASTIYVDDFFTIKLNSTFNPVLYESPHVGLGPFIVPYATCIATIPAGSTAIIQLYEEGGAWCFAAGKIAVLSAACKPAPGTCANFAGTSWTAPVINTSGNGVASGTFNGANIAMNTTAGPWVGGAGHSASVASTGTVIYQGPALTCCVEILSSTTAGVGGWNIQIDCGGNTLLLLNNVVPGQYGFTLPESCAPQEVTITASALALSDDGIDALATYNVTAHIGSCP